MILTECAKFSKPLTLCGCERCSHAETNSQRGSDIRSRGSEDRSGEKWLQLSLLAGLQDVPWIRKERERERERVGDVFCTTVRPAGHTAFLLSAGLAVQGHLARWNTSRSVGRGHFCKLFQPTPPPPPPPPPPAQAAAAHCLT